MTMDRIAVSEISKRFEIGYEGTRTVLERLLGVFSGREAKHTIQVIDGVSFTVREGEIVGVIGSNGGGKSTLLRIIADILKADAGSVVTSGRLIPLIHLDTGMEPRLTLRENIFLLCTFLGFTQKDIKAMLTDIVRYAELEAFLHTKWYQFSDGMKQRAVFSIIMHTKPDILLLDEVFSAGDQKFRGKGMDSVLSLARNGTSVLVVAHNLDVLERVCDRVLWIERGTVQKFGPTREVINAYKAYA